VIDLIKEGANVQINYPGLACLDDGLCCSHCVMGTLAGTEPVAMDREIRFCPFAQDLPYGLLDKPVLYGRDS
jgi:hypothetical protein